jgi:serine phosphatase RsbU (regulator of sigma subunit)/lipopolysaccharide biosynthesis regulator YciM
MQLRFAKILFLFFLLAGAFPSFAQKKSNVPDSLKALLEKEVHDTSKAVIYSYLADYYRFNDASLHQQYALKTIALSRKINFPRGLANGYNLYGQYLENKAIYDNSLLYYDSSLTKWKQMGDEREVAHMYINMANVYNRMGNYPSAAEYTIRALKTQERIHYTFGVAACNLTLGNIYYSQGDTDGALNAYKKAYVLNRLSINNKDFEGAVLGNIGAMYNQKEDYYLALHYMRLAESVFTNNGMASRLGSSYNNIGACFRELGQYDSAIYYGRKGLKIYTESERPEGICNSLMALGLTEKHLGSIDSAMTYFTKGLAIAKKIGTRDLESNFYYELSIIYKRKNDYKKSLECMERYVALNDSLHGVESTSKIEQTQKSYEIGKKNREMEQLHEAKVRADEAKERADEANRRNLIFFIVGGILLLGIIIVVFIALRNKQQHNALLERKNDEISQQKEEITASITYARRIQQSVMPDERILEKSGYEYFILNKPRDIVSGDFFWLAEKDGKTYAAVADCTGHGVPGALVSVIGVNILNKIIEQPGSPSPSEILELLHVMMIHTLNKDAAARDTTDGMDIALLCIDKASGKAKFSGAGRPLYYADASGLHYIKGNRYSVAGEKSAEDAPFSEVEIPLTPGTLFYMSSDGYVDQFGQATGKKFLSKNFNELLAKVSSLPVKEQAKRIEDEFVKWKGNLEQVDDVLVLGIKV